MSLAKVITLASDSAGSLSGLNLKQYPNLSVKPAEIVWNDMQTEDLNDSTARSLFSKNAEINNETSGFAKTERWNWLDFLVEQSIENDAVFVFVPHDVIYPEEQDQIIKATVHLKTGFIEFFKKHERKTGKIKHFIINSGNIFCGVGLVVWQCQEILSRMDPEKNLSLVQLKSVFERYAQRTKTISIMDCGSVSSGFKKQVMDQGFMDRFTSSLKRNQWLSVEFGSEALKLGDRLSLEAQITQHLSDLASIIERKQIAFPRVVIACSNEQWELLCGLDIYNQLVRFIKGTAVKIMHQQLSLTAQILTGKNSFHISYSQK